MTSVSSKNAQTPYSIGVKQKTETEANHKRLLNAENKLEVAGGRWVGGWVGWVTGIKEGAFWDEHWVSYVSDESPASTREAKTTLRLT